MQIYNDQNSSSSRKSTPSCSYCRDTEHRATDCPHVAGDWAMFQKFLIPCSDPDNWTNNPITKQSGQCSWNTQQSMARWNKEPSEWGKWYTRCENAYAKQQQAKTRQSRTGTTRKASKCGFCGSLHHNRRNCPEMTAYTDRIVKANQVWRQRFYDKFVRELGLSVGAVIKVQTPERYNTPSVEKIGIITSVNWEQLSMFCFNNQAGYSWSQRIESKFKQALEIMVSVDGTVERLTFVSGQNSHSVHLLRDQHGGLADVFNGWCYLEYVETIGRSETPLDEDWVAQGHEECAKFVTKKYSREKLDNWNVTRLIEKTEEIQQRA